MAKKKLTRPARSKGRTPVRKAGSTDERTEGKPPPFTPPVSHEIYDIEFEQNSSEPEEYVDDEADLEVTGKYRPAYDPNYPDTFEAELTGPNGPKYYPVTDNQDDTWYVLIPEADLEPDCNYCLRVYKTRPHWCGGGVYFTTDS